MNRRNLLFVALALLVVACTQPAGMILNPEPPRPAGQSDVIALRCDPIDTVHIALIGLGMRGEEALRRLTLLEGVKVTAICDIRPELIDKAQAFLERRGLPAAAAYTGAEGWKEACDRPEIDLVYVCTQWDLHTPIAVYAMENGRHAAIEVPGAITLEECWQLVNTAEKTRKHCMMLENCCYDFFELATLNMAQKGLFGEIVHAEGAYIHDLRFLLFNDTTGYWNSWRMTHNISENGNLYPTHGLGPIAQILDIHRGDKMDYLVSMSSNQFGLTQAAIDRYGADSPQAQTPYVRGDINTTLIRTHKGKTMLIQHDVTSPRPYDRLHKVSGTKGFAQKYPRQGISLDAVGHSYLRQAQLDSLLEVYAHPLVKEIGEKAKEVGGHGGMDFIMDYRLIYCLRNGLPLDQDVYDAAEWSGIIALSRMSVENNSMPVQVPDFTRGTWNKQQGYKHFME
jgi:Predicted dehydrogenases and related proteins